MSRLGRDYLKVGQIMEILRQKGVRLIAVNDGVDSDKDDDDFTPFRNIMKNTCCLCRVCEYTPFSGKDKMAQKYGRTAITEQIFNDCSRW